MSLFSHSLPGFFSLSEHDSPNVPGFLYWLCSRADQRCRHVSDPVREAGNDMILWLLRNVGGELLEAIHSVELFNQSGIGLFSRSFLLVNGTHALLLSNQSCPDEISTCKAPAGWGSDGVKIVVVSCEEMRVFYHWVDHPQFRLMSWGSGDRAPLLSLKALAAHPLLASGAESIHPLIDEFRDCIQPIVAAEESFRELPLPAWDHLAWQGFHKVVGRKLGGKIYMRPLGVREGPFSRIRWKVGGVNCELHDAVFSVEFDGSPSTRLPDLSLYKLWMVNPQLAALGIKLRLEDYVPLKSVQLVGDEPEQTSFSLKLVLQEDFRVMKEDGLINIPLSIGRVSAASEILGRAVQ
jgi:hypothetical protein